uniref:FBA_2 domain-containing protein n=2 Tax=Caenorhabditis tropicalis TaxID=1561998 RepID=A0A1I7TUM1_9PELO
MMNPFELINLSLTSSKARRAVIFFSRIKSRFWVGIGIHGSPFINIKESRRIGMSWEYSWTSNPSKVGLTTHTARLDLYSYECIHLFSESRMHDCMKWYEIIKPVLGCQIGHASVDNPKPSITDWLRSHQDSIGGISILEGDEENVKYLLKTIRVLGDLSLKISPRSYQLEFPEGLTRLEIDTAELINYDQLLRLKVRNINLRGSILTNQEINGFLKSWMSCESHLDLKSIEIDIPLSKAVNEIMDLPHEVTKIGYKIKRCDRKEANVTFGLWTRPYLYLSID